MKNELRKIAKKIIKSFRDFKRRNYRKNIKEEELFSEILSKYKIILVQAGMQQFIGDL